MLIAPWRAGSPDEFDEVGVTPEPDPIRGPVSSAAELS
jgi:hypothetical protein